MFLLVSLIVYGIYLCLSELPLCRISRECLGDMGGNRSLVGCRKKTLHTDLEIR